MTLWQSLFPTCYSSENENVQDIPEVKYCFNTITVPMCTEFPIPSCGEVFLILFGEFPRFVGRYCT